MAFTAKMVRGVPSLARQLSTSAPRNTKVAVLGAAGGIGQPLSLLLKTSFVGIQHLALYDVAHAPGVTADLSHIDTSCKVTSHLGADQLAGALEGANIVVVPAGMPRKPGMSRDDLFNTNASIVATLANAASTVCPNAVLCLITNPVNSMVPLAVDIYQRKNVFNNQVCGVTTLDVVRSNTFIGEAIGQAPHELDIPVIGGHSGVTILPLLSSIEHGLSDEKVKELTVRIQNAGTEVVEAKAGAGSATLSMAYAGARFVKNVTRSIDSSPATVRACGYAPMPSQNQFGMPYFALPLILSPGQFELPTKDVVLNEFESKLLEEEVKPQLIKDIEKGVQFAKQYFDKK
ncbi:malate dehydrogenase-like [Sycon ciliatum]|uniref:malate dehydrogenase-like n=1 Tax=Sycon ciliatum TaxID=27933 RepID=UPI0031F69953